MRNNKYDYWNVIQMSTNYGWEDVSCYECDSTGYSKERTEITVISKRTGEPIKRNVSVLSQDLKEYQFSGGSYRVIFRRELKTVSIPTV